MMMTMTLITTIITEIVSPTITTITITVIMVALTHIITGEEEKHTEDGEEVIGMLVIGM